MPRPLPAGFPGTDTVLFHQWIDAALEARDPAAARAALAADIGRPFQLLTRASAP